MDAIKTPLTHPEHDVVGHDFMAYSSEANGPARFYCDSYDPQIGYWMTRVDAPREHWGDQHSEWRRNVSERAINRTYHRVYVEPDGFQHTNNNTRMTDFPRPTNGPWDAYAA